MESTDVIIDEQLFSFSNRYNLSSKFVAFISFDDYDDFQNSFAQFRSIS